MGRNYHQYQVFVRHNTGDIIGGDDIFRKGNSRQKQFIFMSTGNFDRAAEAYEKAVSRSDQRVIALKAFTARWQAGERDAAAPLREWLASHPDDERMNRVLENSAKAL